jgi:hypothetical protein
MLFRETVAVYCENHTEHINTPCEQNAEFLYFKAGGAYCYHIIGLHVACIFSLMTNYHIPNLTAASAQLSVVSHFPVT